MNVQPKAWKTAFVLCALLTLIGCRKAPPDAMGTSEDAEAREVTPAPAAPHGAEEAPDAEAPQSSSSAEADDAQAEDKEGADAPAEEAAIKPAPADEDLTQQSGRGVAWSVAKRWPVVGEEDEFRVRTWRLPAVSMSGAGECALYRFEGGGDPQENLQRWMGEFRGPDGEVDSVDAAQAERTIQGAPAWLVRAEGQYVSQTPGVEGSEETFDDYALFGAVIIGEGDPVFAKCVGPVEVIAYEANTILAWMDSMKISPN